MHKGDLAATIAEKLGLTKKMGDDVVTTVLDSITNALKNGEKVSLIGFGKFIVKTRAAHKGRNPATGETINIAASKAVGFKVGKKLKEAINK